MNKEIQELYDSMVNMATLENVLESEFQQLEKEHITLNDVFQNRQENPSILLPGDTAILLTKLSDGGETPCWYEVKQNKIGYSLTNVFGKVLHTQIEPYNYEQLIDLNGTSTKV